MLDLGGDAADGQASALSLDTVSMPPPEAAPEPVAAVVEETRGQKVDELAGFGARPRRHFETVPYFVRVLLRKRALELELQGLTAHRKRLDTQTEEALCALGEALYGLHTDARLKPLAQQLRVVAETKKQVGVKEAASLQANDEHGRELQKLQQDVRKVEADAVPLRNREADMQARADKLKAHIKRKEAAARKAEEDIKALRASPDVTAIERIRALEAERDAHVGEVQSRNVQLLPVHEDLGALRREIAKLMETLTALHAEERKYTQAMDREQERHRVSTGGARNALKDVLRALAAAAQQAKLAALAPALATAATDAEARAKTKRNVEETFRAAVQSYDHEAYTRGMYILVGGTIGIFVLFAGMIIF
jgi:chromosome segregation ATPase